MDHRAFDSQTSQKIGLLSQYIPHNNHNTQRIIMPKLHSLAPVRDNADTTNEKYDITKTNSYEKEIGDVELLQLNDEALLGILVMEHEQMLVEVCWHERQIHILTEGLLLLEQHLILFLQETLSDLSVATMLDGAMNLYCEQVHGPAQSAKLALESTGRSFEVRQLLDVAWKIHKGFADVASATFRFLASPQEQRHHQQPHLSSLQNISRGVTLQQRSSSLSSQRQHDGAASPLVTALDALGQQANTINTMPSILDDDLFEAMEVNAQLSENETLLARIDTLRKSHAELEDSLAPFAENIIAFLESTMQEFETVGLFANGLEEFTISMDAKIAGHEQLFTTTTSSTTAYAGRPESELRIMKAVRDVAVDTYEQLDTRQHA